MSDSLATYLNDHLSGAQTAIQVLSAMRDHNDDERFREFAASLLPEIEADDQILRSIVEKIEPNPSAIKETSGWILEKLARLKLGHTDSAEFGMFESLELLALGIQGKRCLWKALGRVSEVDSRLREHDFEHLLTRAIAQYGIVEAQRLNLAEKVFSVRST